MVHTKFWFDFWSKINQKLVCTTFTCLGISPPNLKGRESKEAHEPGQMQDLKLKTTKKKSKKIQKMIAKTSHDIDNLKLKDLNIKA